jgi:secreted trypsin-like serine protease
LRPISDDDCAAVVSWGGSKCGADRLPSVFAQVSRYRSFIADPSPTWAPAAAQPARVTGTRAVGANDGGISTVPFATSAIAKIPR